MVGGKGGNEMSGTEIRNLRKKARLTQEEFAHAIGITVSTANRWEMGHSKPSKLARANIRAFVQSRSAKSAGNHAGAREPTGLATAIED